MLSEAEELDIIAYLNCNDYIFHLAIFYPPLIGNSSFLESYYFDCYALVGLLYTYISGSIILVALELNSFLFLTKTSLHILICFSYAFKLNVLEQVGHYSRSDVPIGFISDCLLN